MLGSAPLGFATLRYASLCSAMLRFAVLGSAVLGCAALRSAVLRYAAHMYEQIKIVVRNIKTYGRITEVRALGESHVETGSTTLDGSG